MSNDTDSINISCKQAVKKHLRQHCGVIPRMAAWHPRWTRSSAAGNEFIRPSNDCEKYPYFFIHLSPLVDKHLSGDCNAIYHTNFKMVHIRTIHMPQLDISRGLSGNSIN
jgi:hypothetical protein